MDQETSLLNLKRCRCSSVVDRCGAHGASLPCPAAALGSRPLCRAFTQVRDLKMVSDALRDLLGK